MRKVTKVGLKAARHLALAGQIEAAKTELSWMAETEPSARASLAELSAFEGDWATALDHIGAVLQVRTAYHTANLFNDFVELAAQAGHRGQPWSAVADLADRVLGTRLAPGQQTIMQALAALAEREGAPPHDVIHVFGATFEQPDPQKYAEAVAEHAAKRDETPEAVWARHAFALANVFRQEEEKVRIFEEVGEHLDFHTGVEVARLLVRRGRLEEAWTALKARIGGWWPLDMAQVAPVVLLTDPDLRRLETPERNAEVLATPRGPAR